MSTGGLLGVGRAGLDAIGTSLRAGRLSGDRAVIQAQDTDAEREMAAELLRCIRQGSVV